MLVRLENNDGVAEELTLVGPGETYTEAVDARHMLEMNASETEEASIIVSVVVETAALKRLNLEKVGLEGLERPIV